MATYCNPINIEYKFQHFGQAAHREAADPTLIRFKDRYYLFASMSAGFYHSDNLVDWAWHENRELALYLYAPDVRQSGDFLYFCASGETADLDLADPGSAERRVREGLDAVCLLGSKPFLWTTTARSICSGVAAAMSIRCSVSSWMPKRSCRSASGPPSFPRRTISMF